jgi:hypothetical protein
MCLGKSSLSLSLMLIAVVSADPIAIPNFSFESPTVSRNVKNPFGALPLIAEWDETGVGPGDEFNQNTGVFLNTDVGEPDHIVNAEQDQLAFLSSLTGNAVRQELPDVYVPGRTYTFTVGVAKSLTLPVGATEQLEVALYSLSGGVEQAIVSTFVSGSQVTSTSLLDVTVTSPEVEAGHTWAGKPVGLLIRPSIADPDDEDGEGFWDVDNARLEVVPPIVTLDDERFLPDAWLARVVACRRRNAILKNSIAWTSTGIQTSICSTMPSWRRCSRRIDFPSEAELVSLLEWP